MKHNRKSTTQRKPPTGRSRKIELSDEDDSQIVTIRKSQTETQLFEREDNGEDDGPETGNQSIAWQNMNTVVEETKSGPWFT